ncbi:MAG: ATP-binding protein [Acidobacteria bacterium]|nr:ATP-binding protein [Acidobacteriota bacterium]
MTHEARCVLCQQELDDSAKKRMEQFRDFLASNAQQETDSARRTFQGRLQALKDCEPTTDQTDSQLAELRLESEDLAEAAEALLRATTTRRDAALEAVEGDAPLPALPALNSVGDEIRAEAANLRDRSKDLLKDNTPQKRAALRSRIMEVESREALGDSMDAVVAEIQRKRELAAYTEALKETNTKAITLKSSDVTKRAVTDRLASAFQEELDKVGFKQLKVTLEPHKGIRGALYHKLTLRQAPSAELSRIASEGESRALALAAFFAELSTAADRSAILFDDPVSSLDHTWRENVARRLAEEACGRQVIVFTHDIVFVLALERAAESRGANCSHQYIRSEATGAGVSTPELPWVAMRVKDRLGVLKKRWQEAEKLHRTASRETYERAAIEIYGLLREAWERAVEEVLLDGVVERYRQSVETRRARKLADIADTDCDALDAGMTKCSRWLRGHDQPPAENTSVPEPDEVKQDIDALNGWVTTIRKRRN